MIPAKLLEANDPILRTKCKPFDFEKDDPQPIFSLLKDTMMRERGIGLAAPQIGDDRQIFIMGNPDDEDSIIPILNPLIVDIISDRSVVYEEGCLTFPGLFIKLKRPSQIRVRYSGLDGEADTIQFEGMTARVFLHEYDHLQGILFTDNAPKYRLDQARQQKKMLDRKRKVHAT